MNAKLRTMNALVTMKQIKPVSPLLIFVISIFLFACSPKPQESQSEMTLLVGPKQADCESAPQRKCYLVKYSASDTQWSKFYDEITAFDWEAGYEYELRVKVTESRPANSDFIFRSFSLIEMISKTPVQ